MAWSAGVFIRTNGVFSGPIVWTSDAGASVKIMANRHDTHDQDLADGINACLHKGGQNTPTAHIPWGNYRITSLGAGVAASDAATYGQTITSFIWNAGTSKLTAVRAAGNLEVTLSGIVAPAWGTVTGTLSDQTDLWAALTTWPQTVSATTYVLALTDAGRHIYMTSANTVTVPPNGTVAFPVGTKIMVVNGTGSSLSVAQGAGVTIRKTSDGTTGNVTLAGYKVASLLKVAANTWFASVE